MTTPHSSDTLDFGEQHFGAASLGDRRRTRRLVRCANEMMSHPDGSLPSKFGSPAELGAFYDLMNNRAVTHEGVFARRRRALTLERMGRHEGVALILHDTTELDYTSRHSLAGLGQIGNGRGRGYECHNSLAVDGDAREVIGLVHQQLHQRVQVPKGEGVAAKRAREDRESLLWLKGIDAVGPAPEGQTWVDVCDRGADTFEFLEAASNKGPGRFFLVRSSISRSMRAGHDAVAAKEKLHEHARGLSEQTRYQLQVPAKRLVVKGKKKRKRKKRGTTAPALPQREATIVVSAGSVRVLASHVRRGNHGRDPLPLWVVAACEVDTPEGMEPVEWFLLTNHPVENPEQAEAVIRWYRFRWIVEELHKAMKTGCGIENPQFTTEEALQPTIALLSVVAVTLLQVREAVRRPDAKQRRAVEVVAPEWVEVLSLWRHNEHRPDWSIHDFYYALARLGGHQNRKSDHFPGWLILWRGWQQFQPMLRGARLRKRCGIT